MLTLIQIPHFSDSTIRRWIAALRFGVCLPLILACMSLPSCAAKSEVQQISVEPENLAFYRDTWGEARSLFIDLSAKARQQYEKVEVGAIPVPGKIANDLEINWLYVPPTGKPVSLVIISSGVHGPEGFAGSALQAMFLREFLPSANRTNTGFLFIHGVNPYGMRYWQRVTENSVDLNRNAPVTPEVYATANPGYKEMDSFLNPKSKVNLDSSYESFFELRLISIILSKGVKGFTQASLGGQYEYPQGIYYGGKEAEPQYKPLGEILKRYISSYSFILGLDVHTGVGRRSYMHIMTNIAPDQNYKKTAEDLFAGHPLDWPDSGEFYATSGDFTTWIEALAKPRQALAVTIEFGTLDSQTDAGSIKSLRNMVRANQAFHFGYERAEDERQVKEDIRQMFFPSSRVWRSEVIRQARETLFTTVKRLDQPAGQNAAPVPGNNSTQPASQPKIDGEKQLKN